MATKDTLHFFDLNNIILVECSETGYVHPARIKPTTRNCRMLKQIMGFRDYHFTANQVVDWIVKQVVRDGNRCIRHGDWYGERCAKVRTKKLLEWLEGQSSNQFLKLLTSEN